MKKGLHLLLIISCMWTGALHAQWQNGLWIEKQANNWFFPKYQGLNFDSSPPTALTNGQMIAEPDPFADEGTESAASISDSEGNLLFYTNGITVWNKNHEIMQNGADLEGYASSTQGSIIIPKPGSSSKYYIFSNASFNFNTYVFNSVHYSEVDMELDNGLGAVTDNKNIPILEPDFSLAAMGNEEKMAAVHHADGINVWVALRQSSSYYLFLVTENGVSSTPVISTAGLGNDANGGGQMKFSPDGTRLAVVNAGWPSMLPEFFTEIFNFNSSTGVVTGPVVSIGNNLIADSSPDFFGVMGVEFSPNSNVLYLSTLLNASVYQFDLSLETNQAIIDSATLLYQNLDPFPDFFYGRPSQLQTGVDGKIYMPDFGQPSLHVIEYPNNVGIAAGFDANGTIPLPEIAWQALPNFIQSYFESGISFTENNCSGGEIEFFTVRIPGVESIVWDFGDPASGGANTSAELQPGHIFSSGGTYTVTALITSNNTQQTVTAEVSVLPAPAVIVPSAEDVTACGDISGFAAFNLINLTESILNGLDAAIHSISYYASPEDIEAGNQISNAASYITDGQTIYSVVTNNVTGCSVLIQFDLVVNPLPLIGNPDDLRICGDSSGSGIFDITTQNMILLNGQSADDFSVLYFTDAGGTALIDQPEAFISEGQTIYTIVTNIVTGCQASSHFDLEVLPLPLLPEMMSFEGCLPFNLVTITGEPEEGTIYTYYTNEDDALNATNQIIDTDSYFISDNIARVFIRAQNAEDCANVSELRLMAGSCFIPRGISPNNDNINDYFDLSGLNVSHLNIFNRYGIRVYDRSNYTDQWHGQDNSNNNLPSGTYYYSMHTNNGDQKTGWVYLIRDSN